MADTYSAEWASVEHVRSVGRSGHRAVGRAAGHRRASGRAAGPSGARSVRRSVIRSAGQTGWRAIGRSGGRSVGQMGNVGRFRPNAGHRYPAQSWSNPPAIPGRFRPVPTHTWPKLAELGRTSIDHGVALKSTLAEARRLRLSLVEHKQIWPNCGCRNGGRFLPSIGRNRATSCPESGPGSRPVPAFKVCRLGRPGRRAEAPRSGNSRPSETRTTQLATPSSGRHLPRCMTTAQASPLWPQVGATPLSGDSWPIPGRCPSDRPPCFSQTVFTLTLPFVLKASSQASRTAFCQRGVSLIEEATAPKSPHPNPMLKRAGPNRSRRPAQTGAPTESRETKYHVVLPLRNRFAMKRLAAERLGRWGNRLGETSIRSQ